MRLSTLARFASPFPISWIPKKPLRIFISRSCEIALSVRCLRFLVAFFLLRHRWRLHLALHSSRRWLSSPPLTLNAFHALIMWNQFRNKLYWWRLVMALAALTATLSLWSTTLSLCIRLVSDRISCTVLNSVRILAMLSPLHFEYAEASCPFENFIHTLFIRREWFRLLPS